MKIILISVRRRYTSHNFRVLKTGELVVFEDADKLMEWFYGKTNSDDWHHSTLDKIETTIITSVKLHTVMHLTRYREDDTIIGHYQAVSYTHLTLPTKA